MSGAFLDYDHPSMQRIRDSVQAWRKHLGVPAGLILNFDQIWKLRHRGFKSKLSKAHTSWHFIFLTHITRAIPYNHLAVVAVHCNTRMHSIHIDANCMSVTYDFLCLFIPFDRVPYLSDFIFFVDCICPTYRLILFEMCADPDVCLITNAN